MGLSNQYLNDNFAKYERLYAYKGLLKHSTITTILSNIKSISENLTTSARIYSIVNELLENSLLHQLSPSDEVEVIVLKDGTSYRIITFNFSSTKDSKSLSEKVNVLNSSDLEKVRNDYKGILMNNLINNKGTIGIGLNLIRLKSKNKVLISMEDFEDYSVVIVDIKIDE